MTRSWTQITVEVPLDGADSVANFLIENGAPGVQFEEEDGRTVLIAHFAVAPPLEPLRRFCADIGRNWTPTHPAKISVREIADDDWAQNWKAHFQPQVIGERLYVCPPWAPAPPPGRIAVVIEPGMAFGTGQHASTRGCLQLLDGVVRGEHRIARALDVGTGSGVLAIAMAKLGIAEVWAIDIDPTARAAAAANAARNHVAACLRMEPTLDDVHGWFDLITANLFANLLQELAPRLATLLRPEGVLICSGLLSADERGVSHAYATVGFAVQTRHEEAPWVTLGLRQVAGT